jgi:altronate dehydratase
MAMTRSVFADAGAAAVGLLASGAVVGLTTEAVVGAASAAGAVVGLFAAGAGAAVGVLAQAVIVASKTTMDNNWVINFFMVFLLLLTS